MSGSAWSASAPDRYIPPVRAGESALPRLSRTPEETLARRCAVLGFALLAAAATAGCDRLPEAVIVPEFDLSYSFESGLEGWTVSSADVGGGSAAAEASSERASQGAHSVRFVLGNPGGAGKVWITRELELTPEKRYTAEIAFDLATADHGVADPWKLIMTARTTPPASAAELDFQGDTGSGVDTGTGTVWVQKRFTLPAKADEEGSLYLTVGIWGTTPGTRTYWLDNIRIVLTRTD